MNFSLSSSDKSLVCEHLRSVGCCRFCILRYLSSEFTGTLRDLEPALSDTAEDADKRTKEEPPEKKAKHANEHSAPDAVTDHNNREQKTNSDCDTEGFQPDGRACVGCYNLLKIAHLKEAINQLRQAVKDRDCTFSTYVLQLSMPVTLDVRHHALLANLKEKFGHLYADCNDITFTTVKEAWKEVITGEFSQLYNARPSIRSSFQLSVTLPSADAKSECGFLLETYPECFPNRIQKKDGGREVFTRRAVQEALLKIPDEKFRSLCSCPPKAPSPLSTELSITCTYLPIYVAGRYCKYSRVLSQTPWLLDGRKIMETSVQELITDVINKRIPNSKIVFSASGREDVDVRMLGRGRPFVLEIFDRRKDVSAEEMEAIEKEINDSTKDIKVNDLQIVDKVDTEILKTGEQFKMKKYSALCCASRPLSEEDVAFINMQENVVLQQKTPIRVLHRRNYAVRERTVYKMSAEVVEDNLFSLQVSAQAGTYVKEFVHGDFGRTVPSLGELLKTAEVDILQLDVEEVVLDWPPPRK